MRDTPSPAPSLDEESTVTVLNQAVRDKLVTRIRYLSRSSGEYSERAIEPHLLHRDETGWYVEAWDLSKEARRTFKVQYVERAEIIGQRFEPRLEMQDLTNGLDSEAGTARILYTGHTAELELERPTSIEPAAEGGAVATVPYGSVRWLLSKVLSHRGQAEVLGPDWLREAVRDQAESLLHDGRARARSRLTFASATRAFALEVAAVEVGDVEPAVALREPIRRRLQPVGQPREDVVDVVRLELAGPALGAAVPRTHVLADVAAVDPVLERLGERQLLQPRLRQVGEAQPCVEGSLLEDRAGRAGVDAGPALAAGVPGGGLGVGMRGGELGVGDQHAEDDPRAVAAGDRHRVLPGHGDARPDGGLPVDVPVGVDVDHEPRTGELTQVLAQRPQPVAEHGVLVAAGVPGQPSARLVAGLGRLRARVAVRRGHHGARVAQQQLGMARAVGTAHREAHVGEQPALASLEDRPLGPPVGLGPADAAGGELQAVGLGEDGGGQLARLHPITLDAEPQPSPADIVLPPCTATVRETADESAEASPPPAITDWRGTRLLVVAAAGITAIAAQISFGYPVPTTLQTFAVFSTAAVLGARLAVASQLLYLAAGAIGLPVFADGRGGIDV